MKKEKKKRENTDRWHISAAILAWRRPPVAFVIALDPLCCPMHFVTYRHTDRASKTADKYGIFLPFFYGIRPCCPSAQWQRPVASREAMDSCRVSIQGRCASKKYCSMDNLQGENWKFHGWKIVELHYFLFYESIWALLYHTKWKENTKCQNKAIPLGDVSKYPRHSWKATEELLLDFVLF